MQSVENLNETESIMGRNPVCGEILDGDRTNRFKLVGSDGQSSVVALADDVYGRFFFAESFGKAMEEANKQHQLLNSEARRLFQIIDNWKAEHKDRIDLNETKVLKEILVSSSGKFRFQFFVVPKDGQVDFFDFDKALVLLDQAILDDPEFTIVRLVSMTM